MYHKIRARHDEIIKYFTDHQSVTPSIVMKLLGISRMTALRDLKFLSEKEIIRHLGQGVFAKNNLKKKFQETSFSKRARQNEKKKKAIAKFINSNFLTQEVTAILEGGTTAAHIARSITNNITIITNGLPVLNEAFKNPSKFTIISCGGILRKESSTFLGNEVSQFFKKLFADYFFVSGIGLSLERGLTDINPDEVNLKQLISKYASRTIVCVDSSKIGKESLSTVIPISQVSSIVVDDGITSSDRQALIEKNIEVFIAPAV